MRMPRIKLEDRVCAYHCISRTVGGEFLLDDLCKEHFVRRMWRQADFCGVDILTYSVMSNCCI